jgi:hypothetical protein
MSKEKQMKTTSWVKTGSFATLSVRWPAVHLLLLGLVFLLMPRVSLAQVPLIQQLKPTSVAPAGGADVTLIVYGANFTSNSTVNFNGSPLTTMFDGTKPSQLTATVPASDTASAGTAVITVFNPAVQICPVPSCPPNPLVTVIPASTSNAVLFPISNQPATLNFATLPSIEVGAGAQSLAVGHFTSSGFADLAVVTSGTNQVSVLLGNGKGGFTMSGPFATGHNPQAVALGDFNGDGSLDMAVVNENDNTVSIFIGDGTGNFKTPAPTYTLQSGVGPVALVTADLDGDGILDLAVVNQLDHSTACGGPMGGQGSISFLQGKGDGTFTQFSTQSILIAGSTELVIPGTLSPFCLAVPASSIVAGLFNLGGPGMPDLVVNNGAFVSSGCPLGDGTVTILTNEFLPNNLTASSPAGATGGLAFGTNSFCVGKTPSGLAAGDFNLDGNLDLAVANFGDGTVTILIGKGDGTFQPSPNTFAVTEGLGPVSIAVGDFNVDGNDDLIVAGQGSDNVSLLTGDGHGNFAAGTNSPFTTLDASSNGHGPVSVVAADFNGDGLLDVATADTSGLGYVSTLLQGIGVTFNPTCLAFTNPPCPPAAMNPSLPPGQPIGTTSSSPLSTTVTGGTIEFTIQTLTLTGPNANDFSFDPSTTCKAGTTMLTSTQTCVVAVNFTPSDPGERQAVIQFALTNTSLGLSISQAVPIQGNALAQPIQLTPSSLNLAGVLVGTSSTGSCASGSPSCVTIQNVGTNPMSITSIVNTDTAEFQLNDPNSCATKTYQPNDMCQFSVTFSPTTAGLRTDAFKISANLSGSVNFSQSLPVAGEGLAPLVSVSGLSLTFPNQQIGTTSAVETVTLTNIGTAGLTFASTAAISPASPDFRIVPPPSPLIDCRTLPSSKLLLSSSCSVGVLFTPSFITPYPGVVQRSATLVFSDNNNAVNGSVQLVAISGPATFPVVSLSTGSPSCTANCGTVPFGGVPITTTGAPTSFTLANIGSAPLDLGSIIDNNTTEFKESDNCPRSPAQLGVNTFCTITVTFTPSVIGARSATLTFTDDNLGSLSSPGLSQMQVVNLSGTGTDFTISASPASITITPSKTATYTITLHPIDGFNNP